MRDRTAMTEPLTVGQQIVARWEGSASGWSEPADLAEVIDSAIAGEREACALLADEFRDLPHGSVPVSGLEATWAAAKQIADAIRNRE